MIAFNPLNTVGVFATIFELLALPADPAAAARTARCASSSDSALKAVVASDFIEAEEDWEGSWFREAETVLASFAKFMVAAWTAETEGSFDDDVPVPEEEEASVFAPLELVLELVLVLELELEKKERVLRREVTCSRFLIG